MNDLKLIFNTALNVAQLVYYRNQWENPRGLNTSASNCRYGNQQTQMRQSALMARNETVVQFMPQYIKAPEAKSRYPFSLSYHAHKILSILKMTQSLSHKKLPHKKQGNEAMR